MSEIKQILFQLITLYKQYTIALRNIKLYGFRDKITRKFKKRVSHLPIL